MNPPSKRRKLSDLSVDSGQSHDHNQSNHNHNATNNNQQLPQQLQRKKARKKKPIANKINDIIRKCRERMGYLQLVNVICIDEENVKWWYCTTCAKIKTKKVVKYVGVREICTHLESGPHGKSLPQELKLLNEERIKKSKAKKEQEMNMKSEYNKINKIGNMKMDQDLKESDVKIDVFKFNDKNKWHLNIKHALRSLTLSDEITWDQMRAINWMYTIHSGIMSLSSISQIEEALQRDINNEE